MPGRVLTCVAALTVAACSFDTSGMGGGPDDSDGRVPDGSQVAIDARVVEGDAAAMCQAVCTGDGTCNGDICEFDCSGSNSCSGGVDCPDGVPCDVNCQAGGSPACSGPINCPPGQPCTIDCRGVADVLGGVDECTGTIDCSQSCACDVQCGAFAQDPPTVCSDVICPPGCDDGNGCTSNRAGCDTCN